MRAARLSVALPLIALGAVSGIIGIVRWRVCEIALRRREPVPRPVLGPLTLGIGTAAFGVLAFVLAVLNEVR